MTVTEVTLVETQSADAWEPDALHSTRDEIEQAWEDHISEGNYYWDAKIGVDTTVKIPERSIRNTSLRDRWHDCHDYLLSSNPDVLRDADVVLFVDYWEERSDDDPAGWAGIETAGKDPEENRNSGIVDTNYSSVETRYSGYEGIAFHELLHTYRARHNMSSTFYNRRDRYSAIWSPGSNDIDCKNRTDASYHSFQVSDCTQTKVRNYISDNNLS